jgi:quercetin dioxygenase-like cupin family protein
MVPAQRAGVVGPVGTPLQPAGMVSYQEGAIVSRALLDKDAGTITVFAFARGQGLSEHTAPFDAVVMVLEGEADVVIAGEGHRLKPGEAIIMPANVPHAVRAPANFKMALIMIRG